MFLVLVQTLHLHLHHLNREKMSTLEAFIVKLYTSGALKMGSFEIKKEFFTPFQLDMGRVISDPHLASEMCTLMWEKISHLSFDLLCGTPINGSALATHIAWSHEKHLVLHKTGIKNPLHSQKIEGAFKNGQRCLVIQDKIITGNGAIETMEDLVSEGLEAKEMLAFIDFEMGGKKRIRDQGYMPHSILTISQALQILSDANKLPEMQFKIATDFLTTSKVHGKK